jgi:type II secretion system protein J
MRSLIARLPRLPRKKLRGFTLMEGLIASSLLAIIGVFMATSISSSINAKEIVEETSGRYHVVRQAMSRMVDEISMAYITAHNTTPDLRVRHGFLGERDELHFIAFGHVRRKAEARESDSRELSYFLGTDERTGTEAIIRRVQVNPDDEFDEGGREQTLLPDVVDLEFEYFDPQREDWSDKWDFEGAETRNRLPTRVRIRFTARMPGEREQTFVSQTKIWLVQPQSFR